MKRRALVSLILLAALAGLTALVVYWPASGGRAQEACVKDAIFCVQRAAKAVGEAEDYGATLGAGETLRVEAGKLDALRGEFVALPSPSLWERSRMRKHRQLAESTLDSWTTLESDFRQRVAGGGFPPHVRQPLIDELDQFARARAEAWAVIMTFPD